MIKNKMNNSRLLFVLLSALVLSLFLIAGHSVSAQSAECSTDPESPIYDVNCADDGDDGDEPFPPVDIIEPVIVSSCGILSVPGSYQLDDSISSDATCLYINSSDISLDCKGNSIIYGNAGAGNSYGIFAQAKRAEGNLTIKNCNIMKSNTLGSNSYGIYSRKYSNSSYIDNIISTSGRTRNYGIYIYASKDSVLSGNEISTFGTAGNNYGIYMHSGADNQIAENTISTNGTNGNYGMRIYTSSNTEINNNLVHTSGKSRNNGIFLRKSSNNIIINNEIETNYQNNYNKSVSNNAFYIWASSNNNFSENSLSTNDYKNQSNAFNLIGASRGNSFKSNAISNIDGYSLYSDSYIDGTSFIDQTIGSFNIEEQSSDLMVQSSNIGKIILRDAFSGEDSNFSDYLRMNSDGAYVNPGFSDISAEITLIPLYNDSIILYNDLPCPEQTCSILDSNAISFNSNQAGKYSLYSAPKLSFVYPTPSDNSIINFPEFSVNASLSGSISNIADLTLSLSNSTDILYTDSAHDSNIQSDYSLPDGVYSFTASVVDSFENSDSISRTLTIDTIAPVIEFNAPTDASGSSKTSKSVVVNVTASDSLSGINEMSIYFYNSTSLMSITAVNSAEYYLEYSNLSDGIYYYNVIASDNAGNIQSSDLSNVTIFTPVPANPGSSTNSGGGSSGGGSQIATFVEYARNQSQNASLTPLSTNPSTAPESTSNTETPAETPKKSFITGAVTGMLNNKGATAGFILALLIIIYFIYKFLPKKNAKAKNSKKN